MGSKFKIGSLVWAKMKGFMTWPGKVIEPKAEVKAPKDRRKHLFVFFFGSENYAWVAEENIYPYMENKQKYMMKARVPKGFKEAIEAIDEALKNAPDELKVVQEEPEVTSTTPKTTPRPKKIEKTSEKKKENKSIGRPPKKRAGSPVSSSASAPKKGKIHKETNHMDIVMSTQSNSPDTSLNQIDYRDYISTVTDSKSRRTSQQPKIKDPSFLPDYTFSTDIPSKESVIATPLKIGFLGLGLMGSGMVLNLLRSGHEVTVWNRTPSKCKDFIKDGALKGNSPSDVVQQCDITFSSVSDPAALKDLVFGNCGVLQGINEGKGYVDMSTIDVETAGDIHEAITARGGRFLEAPVIGSKGQASEGSLVILAAGDQTLYEDCYSCFAAMGKKTYYLGEIGSAAKMTLVLNMLRGTVIAGLAESLALAEKVGLDTDEVMQILQMDPVACPMIKSMANDMLQSNYSEPKCKLQVLQKDLRLAVNMSDSVDQPLHVGAAVNELYKKAKAKGYGEHDVTAVYRAADL